jgi:hypothetical protein
MPRFVVLEHDWPQRHWDFMLETNDMLRTWRLTAPPAPGTAVDAELSFDHRKHYLDYEGPLSEGRGSVLRWDAGVFTWEANTADLVAVVLKGSKLGGKVTITRGAGDQWCLFCHKD